MPDSHEKHTQKSYQPPPWPRPMAAGRSQVTHQVLRHPLWRMGAKGGNDRQGLGGLFVRDRRGRLFRSGVDPGNRLYRSRFRSDAKIAGLGGAQCPRGWFPDAPMGAWDQGWNTHFMATG